LTYNVLFVEVSFPTIKANSSYNGSLDFYKVFFPDLIIYWAACDNVSYGFCFQSAYWAVNQHLLEYKVTTGLPEQIILEPAQHYTARDGENSYCLGLDQQFSPGCKTGHHKGKNAQQSKPIAVITVPLIFTKCSFLISL
jgi:hypothetical protein